MPLESRDPAHLWDMLDAAQAVRDHAAGVTFDTYLSSRLIRGAVERELEILGEAAKRVSQSVKTEHPQIPWGLIVAQRNILAHEYGEIKQERIWAVVRNDIPLLIELLIPLLPPEPPCDVD